MSRIVVHGLEKSYGDARVLERVNVTAEAGEFLSLVGASGCGKSTFLRILLGQEQQSSGVVIVGDGPIIPEPTPQRGIVFQRYSVFPHLTSIQNL
ncbi:MAG: ATP-binding cassette domain-containing protein, partial [Mesorhizobium sp.]